MRYNLVENAEKQTKKSTNIGLLPQLKNMLTKVMLIIYKMALEEIGIELWPLFFFFFFFGGGGGG